MLVVLSVEYNRIPWQTKNVILHCSKSQVVVWHYSVKVVTPKWKCAAESFPLGQKRKGLIFSSYFSALFQAGLGHCASGFKQVNLPFFKLKSKNIFKLCLISVFLVSGWGWAYPSSCFSFPSSDLILDSLSHVCTFYGKHFSSFSSWKCFLTKME